MMSYPPAPDVGPPGAADGLWCEVSAENFAGRPALFLDRDGVIVEDTHYLGRAQDVRMLAGAGAGDRALQSAWNSGGAGQQSIGHRARAL